MTAPNLPAMIEEYGTGLEDIEDEVGAVPRIGINHKGGTFKDSLSGEEFAEIVGVPLGLVKQRVMWDRDVEDNKKPLCKSNDAKTGYPNPDLEKDGGFPWSDAQGLDPNSQPKDEFNRTIISCSGCPFAEWGKNPKTGKSTPPPCKERYTMPVIYNKQGNGYEPPYMESGIVAFQGASITPTKRYLSAFVRAKLPLYSAVARFKLNVNRRGQVDYSVVEISKVADVPQEDWEQYGRDLPSLREYLTRAPRADDDGGDSSRSHGQSASQAAKNAGVIEGEEDAGYIPAGPPSTQAAQPVATPVAAPVQPAAPAAPVQAAQPVSEQTFNGPAAADNADDDELPF